MLRALSTSECRSCREMSDGEIFFQKKRPDHFLHLGNGLKICQCKFRFDIRILYVNHWNRPLKKVVESLSLKVFRKCVNMALRTWFNGECGGGAGLIVGLDDFKGFFQP